MLADYGSVTRTVDGKTIPGVTRPVFIHNGPYFLTDLAIYRDGAVDCWGLVDFDEFCDMVQSGRVVTRPPDGAEISIHHLASFTVREVLYAIAGDDLIGEVRDAIEALNDRPTSSETCRRAFDAFNETPTDEAQAELKLAYEAVPRHLRPYLGDMDVKDIPIRMAIYGEGEIERWSHRLAARQRGLVPLPTIRVPGLVKRQKPPQS
jgi:hypothetical protein